MEFYDDRIKDKYSFSALFLRPSNNIESNLPELRQSLISFEFRHFPRALSRIENGKEKYILTSIESCLYIYEES